MSKPRKLTSPADMSLPPELRRRRRKGRVAATPPAQMDHANSPRARRHRRDGERWLAAEASERAGNPEAFFVTIDEAADFVRRIGPG